MKMRQPLVAKMFAAALVSTTTLGTLAMASNAEEVTLASCDTENGLVEVSRIGDQLIKFSLDGGSDDQSQISILTSAKKEFLESQVRFSLVTAYGNFIDIAIPVAGGGTVSIFDRGVIGNFCAPLSAKINMEALNQLVLDAHQKPRYLFATCISDAGENATVTVREGMAPHTAIFEASPFSRGSEEVSYVAKRVFDDASNQWSFSHFEGEGRYTFYGLGVHNKQIMNMVVSTEKSTGISRINFADANDSGTTYRLHSCKLNNVWYVKRILGAQ